MATKGRAGGGGSGRRCVTSRETARPAASAAAAGQKSGQRRLAVRRKRRDQAAAGIGGGRTAEFERPRGGGEFAVDGGEARGGSGAERARVRVSVEPGAIGGGEFVIGERGQQTEGACAIGRQILERRVHESSSLKRAVARWTSTPTLDGLSARTWAISR